MTAFRRWVDAQADKPAQIAERLGVHRVTLYGYLSGAKMPRPSTVARIEEVTAGAVTAGVLLADYRTARQW